MTVLTDVLWTFVMIYSIKKTKTKQNMGKPAQLQPFLKSYIYCSFTSSATMFVYRYFNVVISDANVHVAWYSEKPVKVRFVSFPRHGRI